MTFRPRLFCSSLALAACAISWVGGALADELAAGPPADTFNLEEDIIPDLVNVTGLRFLPDGRLAILEQGGALKIRKADGSTVTVAYTFDVVPTTTNSERGLLGVVAHPGFASNKRIIVYWSRSDASGGSDTDRQRVASFVLGDDDKIDPDSEIILVEKLAGPDNHNGGAMDIGTDGMLYVGTGDTGCNGTHPTGSNQYHGNLLGSAMNSANGKVLRVDPNAATPNNVPADNPFVNATNVSGVEVEPHSCGDTGGFTVQPKARPEIFAVGFRNVWRMWVDPATGLLWAGDVGDETYEEIDIVEKGKHYGWPLIEGPGKDIDWPLSKCNDVVPIGQDCTRPVYACRHGDEAPAGEDIDVNCKSITGGLIVDSCKFPTSFRGKYFFGDNANGAVWTLDVTADRRGIVPGSRQNFLQSNGGAVELTEGPDGNLYMAVRTNSISRIARVSPKSPVNDPMCVRPGSGGAAGASGAAGAGQGGAGGAAAGQGGAPTGGAGGLGGGSGGVGGAGKAGAGGVSNGGDGHDDDDDGCGCHAAGRESASGLWLAALAAGALVPLARRASRRRKLSPCVRLLEAASALR